MEGIDRGLSARIERLERVLLFYATARVTAIKKVAFDDGHGDCQAEWVQDHGDLAREVLGLLGPRPVVESCGGQLDLEEFIGA